MNEPEQKEIGPQHFEAATQMTQNLHGAVVAERERLAAEGFDQDEIGTIHTFALINQFASIFATVGEPYRAGWLVWFMDKMQQGINKVAEAGAPTGKPN